MHPPLSTNKHLDVAARTWLKPVEIVVDIGPGIRPVEWIDCDYYICIEPHWEYIEVLEKKGYHVIHATAEEALPTLTGIDTIIMFDVIEHMEKEIGRSVIKTAIEKVRQQIAIFTPIGFAPQDVGANGLDKWGLHGGDWQRHKSGWEPSEFPGWNIFEDPTYHKDSGAFLAVLDV